MLGAIAYVAYRRSRRKNRVSRQNSPETDAIMMAFGAILLLWPVAIATAIYRYLDLERKKKYWLMFSINGFLLMTLVPLGWEVYFLYGFVVMLVAIGMLVWEFDFERDVNEERDT
jgi:uncharacterized membrane protein YhaH (DUF805 family)